jgi:hypothetical protein
MQAQAAHVPQGSQQEPDALGLLYLAADSLATTVAVLIRRGFGKEALSWNSLFAFIALLFMASEHRAFLIVLGVFTLGQVCRRFETYRLIRKGVILHTRYPGYPYAAMRLPFVRSERVAKELVEPLMCFVGGLVLCPLSVPVGGYVMLCGLGFIIRHGLEEWVSRRRIDRMRDAAIEHEWYAEHMKR